MPAATDGAPADTDSRVAPAAQASTAPRDARDVVPMGLAAGHSGQLESAAESDVFKREAAMPQARKPSKGRAKRPTSSTGTGSARRGARANRTASTAKATKGSRATGAARKAPSRPKPPVAGARTGATGKPSGDAKARKGRSARATSNGAGAKGRLQNSRAYRRAYQQARKLLKDPKALSSLLDKAKRKASGHAEDLDGTVRYLRALLRLIKAYSKREYQEIPFTPIVTATAAVIYFVNPLDLIPDAIPVAGYLDDAALILFVVAAMQQDLDDFLAWEGGDVGGTVVPA